MNNIHPDTSKQKIIMIEGNIGAGKSTFLKLIQEKLAVQIVPEPLHMWQHPKNDQNLLDMFYHNPERWAYTFQTYAFVSRIIEQERMTAINPYSIQILERSVFSDRYCFAYTLYEQKAISPLEWHMYKEWFSWLVDTYVAKPHGFIYLRTNPEICYQRMQKRNRSEEIGVSRDYLSTLHNKHEQWLLAKEGISDYLKRTPVLVLECDKEFETDTAIQNQHLERIMQFCRESINQPVDYFYQSALSL